MVAALNSMQGRVLGRGPTNNYRQVRDGTGNSPFDIAQPQQSPGANPALSAMANTGAGPRGVLAGQTNPAAGPPKAAGPFSAQTVDTSKAEGSYDEALKNNQQLMDQQRSFGENYLSSLQRKNGSNAALMGLSAGGGSYLSGQRAAFSQGINALNQSLLPFAQQQTNIYGAQAGMQGNAAATNAGFANQAGMANTQYGIDQTKNQDEGKTQQFHNQIAELDNKAKDQANIYGHDNKGAQQAKWVQLRSSYDAAVAAGQWEQAQALYVQMNSMINRG